MSHVASETNELIRTYLNLPLGHRTIACPYFNNKRSQVRAGLRVLIGKGSATDIVDEVQLIALREKVDLDALDEEQLREFLVDHNIGVDCSGLVYYLLDAEARARKQGALRQHLSFPHATNIFRTFLTRLRPVENTNVQTLADDRNSKEVNLADVAAGDLIVILKAGYTGIFDHVLFIHEVNLKADIPATIHYTHSYQWSSDGKYNHGVRQGSIAVDDVTRPLLDQVWEEQGETGKTNETRKRAEEAKVLQIRRLNIFA